MSDAEKTRNAARKGRAAFWNGISKESNPFTAADSRHAWFEAWEDEERRKKQSDEALRNFQNGDRHALKHRYFVDVDVDIDID